MGGRDRLVYIVSFRTARAAQGPGLNKQTTKSHKHKQKKNLKVFIICLFREFEFLFPCQRGKTASNKAKDVHHAHRLPLTFTLNGLVKKAI